MSKSAKHYLESGKAYSGPVHKMGKEVMTGSVHTAKSQKLMHSKPGEANKGPATRATNKK